MAISTKKLKVVKLRAISFDMINIAAWLSAFTAFTIISRNHGIADRGRISPRSRWIATAENDSEFDFKGSFDIRLS
jgi:hypothetical protein